MRIERIASFAAVLALAGSMSAQQPANPAAAPSTPASPSVQNIPGFSGMDAEQLGPIENAGTVRIRAGSGTVVTMSAAISRVAVGDEKLLAVHVLEPREVLMQGLVAGRSTLFVWLADHRRLRYDVIVTPKIDVLRSSLRDLDAGIEAELSADGAAIVLRGDVASEHVAKEAEGVTTTVLGGDASGVRIVNLLRFPASTAAGEQAMTSALESVDPRIRARRIQVSTAEGAPATAVLLEGRVRNLSSLVRAITLADLQMGGAPGKIEPVGEDLTNANRRRNSTGVQGLGNNDPPQGTLATYIARGLVLRSSSGKVLSFLEVDELPQIAVSIRALQVDRGKARSIGVDYRIDAKHVSIGSFNRPGATILPTARSGGSVNPLTGAAASGGILAGAGNILASFVDQTIAITAAIDLLEQKNIARAVAEPTITTLSGEQASVLVGGSIPIPTTTVGNVTAVQGFSFEQFGVSLDIRPTLNPNGLIALELAPSIIKPNTDLSVGGVPGFEIQTVLTQARVAPGQSLVIGGLLSFDDVTSHRGVPGLSSIPVIRHLFSWHGSDTSEKELIFVITPRLVSDSVLDRPLDEAGQSTMQALPYGAAPVLPATHQLHPETDNPNLPTKMNGLPVDFPLAATSAPHPDLFVTPAPAALLPAVPAETVQPSSGTPAPALSAVAPATYAVEEVQIVPTGYNPFQGHNLSGDARTAALNDFHNGHLASGLTAWGLRSNGAYQLSSPSMVAWDGTPHPMPQAPKSELPPPPAPNP